MGHNAEKIREFLFKNESPMFLSTNDKKVIKDLVMIKNNEKEVLKHFISSTSILSDKGYWYVLGIMWIANDIVNINDIFNYLFTEIDKKHKECCMSVKENIFLEKLPEKVIAYRVHHEDEGEWMSLTLSKKVSKGFCERYSTNKISVYEVDKKDIFAYFNKRKEEEILVLNKGNLKKIREESI